MIEDQKKTIIKNARTFVECQKHDSIEKSCMIGLLSVIDIVKEESGKRQLRIAELESSKEGWILEKDNLETENKELEERISELTEKYNSLDKVSDEAAEAIEKLQDEKEVLEAKLKTAKEVILIMYELPEDTTAEQRAKAVRVRRSIEDANEVLSSIRDERNKNSL